MKNLIKIITALLFVLSVFSFAEEGARELASFDITTAKNRAMGGAAITSVNDANAIFVNPSLIPLSTTGITASYNYDGFTDTDTFGDKIRGAFGFILQSGEARKEWGFGIGATTFTELDIDKYTSADAANGTFNYSDINIKAAFAKNIAGKQLLAVGGSFYTTVIDDETYIGAGLNVAFTTSIMLESIKVNAQINNIGGFFNGNDEVASMFDLDTKLTVGVGYSDNKGNFSIALAVSYSFPSGQPDFSAGLEARVINFDSLLMADTPMESSDLGDELIEDGAFEDAEPIKKRPGTGGLYIRAGVKRTSPSLGLGLNLWRFRLDYAIYTDDFSDRELNQALGFSVLF